MTLSAHFGNLKIYSRTLGYVFLKCFEKDILKNKGLTDTFHGFWLRYELVILKHSRKSTSEN